jgi:predicted transcriptional regulator
MQEYDLTPYGLTQNQSLVYQKWLQYGTRQVTTLARFCGLHRVLTYNTLQELCKMGLATCVMKWWTGLYTMIDPSILGEKLKEKIQSFGSILPSLQSMIKQQWWSFQVQSFVWMEWLKTLYDFVTHSKTHLKAFLWADHIDGRVLGITSIQSLPAEKVGSRLTVEKL